MSNVKVYFILYIVLLCEMFIVILDRDDAVDELKEYLVTGIGPDFNLVAPDKEIDFTFFGSISDQISKSDVIQTVIMNETFLKGDIINSKIYYGWVDKPKVLFNQLSIMRIPVDSLRIRIEPVNGIKGNYILTIFYSGPKLFNQLFESSKYDTGIIGIKFELLRLLGTPKMRFEEKEGKYVVIPDTLKFNKFASDKEIINNGKKYYLREFINYNEKKYLPIYGYTEVKVIFKVKMFRFVV